MHKIALTFDDGPHPKYTVQVLKILEEFKIQATFFVVGANLKKYPHLLKIIAKKGHVVGNHTYNHLFLPTVCGTIFDEVLKTQSLIDSILGPTEKIFRSPFGISPPWILKKLSNAGFRIAPTVQATWGHDYLSWMTSEMISQRILANVSGDSIVLLHDSVVGSNEDRTQTIKALRPLIMGLLLKDYKFGSLDDITQVRDYRKYFYP